MRKIGHDITPQPNDDEPTGQAAARTASVSFSSSTSSSFKRRKRSTTNGGSTSTTTETGREPDEPVFKDLNNPFLVQADASETEIDETELGSSTQGRGASWSDQAVVAAKTPVIRRCTQAAMTAAPARAMEAPVILLMSLISQIYPTLNLEYYVALNQPVKWIVEDMDLVQKFQKFRAENLHDFSLARDGVADLSVGSKFRRSLAPEVGKAASKLGLVGELHATWPTLTGILGRVFAKNHYDDVAEAITHESMKDPVARYIMSVISSYAHYFAFQDHVPTRINERQGFADLTWPFIRGAMTMTGVETQYLEVLISGVLERKNLEKDDLTEAK
ncbi:hypothetical protein BGX24_008815 [Mortierella sp. AD032]|nr:hypothetical protein BGX24_008815 [Mortierella sp. AD032]